MMVYSHCNDYDFVCFKRDLKNAFIYLDCLQSLL